MARSARSEVPAVSPAVIGSEHARPQHLSRAMFGGGAGIVGATPSDQADQNQFAPQWPLSSSPDRLMNSSTVTC
jgi:hypothetical protein